MQVLPTIVLPGNPIAPPCLWSGCGNVFLSGYVIGISIGECWPEVGYATSGQEVQACLARAKRCAKLGEVSASPECLQSYMFQRV